MNPVSLRFRVLQFILPLTATLLPAQSASPGTASPPALGLLRLKPEKAGQPARLAAARFTVDDLLTHGAAGASKSKRDSVDVLIVDPGKEWGRPLRGAAKDITFVSFQVNASQGTIIEVGGARLGVTASLTAGNFQLMFDDSTIGTLQWRSLNYHIGSGRYAGRELSALPILTVRLDPITNTWDLYAGSRLVADNLPIISANKDKRQFALRAGNDGAWLSGLVMSDENPLYEDANGNGIDDVFEKQRRGALLAASANVQERKLLADDWKDSQRRKAPPALFHQRPAPDATVASIPTKP